MLHVAALAACFSPQAIHPVPGGSLQNLLEPRVSHPPLAQFGLPKVQKSERLLIREAWERADAYRPGKANWFTQRQKDLVELHNILIPEIEALPSTQAEAAPTNATSLLGALLKSLTTGDLALTLCSKEPPVLTELRDWLVAELDMEVAVLGLPEEQGRVLSTIVSALDARQILDLGTFTGYSSIAMALAAADDARIVCCETNPDYARAARDWWMKAGVSSKMEMHEVCAVQLMQELLQNGGAGTYDVIFVDVGARERYAECHELAMQLLHVGGVALYYDTLWSADTVLDHEPYPTMRKFNLELAADPRVLTSLVPLSYGMTICFKSLSLDGEALRAARSEAGGHDEDELRQLLEERRRVVQAELDQLPS